VWRRGEWHNGWRNGRFGWWWTVDGVWYFYDQPVYPYPEIVSDVTIIEPEPPAPQAAVYYYCQAPAGLYPSVPRCSIPFQPVYYYCDQPAGYYPLVPACALPFRMVYPPPPQ